jgi:hypothetical protein
MLGGAAMRRAEDTGSGAAVTVFPLSDSMAAPGMDAPRPASLGVDIFVTVVPVSLVICAWLL